MASGSRVLDERRRCDHCGDFIDPKDWRHDYEGRGMKRKDAKYCNDLCRSAFWSELRRLQREWRRKAG